MWLPCRCWAPLVTDCISADTVLATVQDTLDYSALAVFRHNRDSIPFNSLGDLVADQLALRVEHMTKDFIVGERSRLGHTMPSWRLMLNTALKGKLLHTIAIDALRASLQQEARPGPGLMQFEASLSPGSVSLPGPPAGGPGFQSPGPAAQRPADLSSVHLERLRPHIGDQSVVGYLLRLPYSETLLAPPSKGGASDVEKALRATGLASLDYPDMKYAQAATVEHYRMPFICCVWLYVMVLYKEA